MVSSMVVSSSPLTVGFSNASSREHRTSVSWLHKAIRDHEWEDIPEILQEQPQLIFRANTRGWNALHVAASSRPYGFWWKWLLQQTVIDCSIDCGEGMNNAAACISGPMNHKLLAEAMNDMGQTILDLLFRYFLYPLPWQRQSLQERANHLRQAMESLVSLSSSGSKNDQDIFKRIRQELYEDDTTKKIDFSTASPETDMDRVVVFWKNLLLLLKAMHVGAVQFEEIPVLQLLARAHWCPCLVAQIAVRLFPGQLVRDPLPLHIWCQTPKISSMTKSDFSTSSFSSALRLSTNLQIFKAPPSFLTAVVDAGMMPALCQARPEAAAAEIAFHETEGQDDDPRQWNLLPLAVALMQGKIWAELDALFDAFPFALYSSGESAPNAWNKKGQRRLPLFCLPTLHTITFSQAEWAAKRQDPQRLSIWCYLSKADKERAIHQAREQLELQKLYTMYELLRRNPSAVAIGNESP